MPKSNHYILKYGDWKFGQGNASIRTLHQPLFVFPTPKEKRKCISASVQMGPASVWTHLHICMDGIFLFFYFFSCVRSDAVTGPRGRNQRPRRQEKKI
jgi:hypothetical protein